MRQSRFLAGAVLLVATALATQSCTRTAEAPTPAEAPAAAPASDMAAVVSVRELMTNLVDPLSDNIFDAVGSDVTSKGIVETKPTTDEDWARVRQGAIVLAEASNLLKIPRKAAPAHDYVSKNPGELAPADIDAAIEKNRGAWNAFANAMRTEAIKVLDVVDRKDVNGVLKAGSDIDRTCEACHLTFWYPGDREAVLKDRSSRAYTDPVKK
ncbi:MAG: hypothetical protein FJW14_17160 [Acidimicrobiia bacterium]|nr:hypothetical protein [Acidimicrobiia bacterium]